MGFADIWWQLLILGVAAYFFGNINSSVIISKLRKQDVRKMGSGNPGTMNMLRNFGGLWGLLTLTLDILKGVIPCLIGVLVYRNVTIDGFNIGDLALYVAGVAVIIGHIYPVLLKFKGGKGVATTFGVFFVANWWLMAIFLLLTVLLIVLIEYGGLVDLVIISGFAIYEGITFTNNYVGAGLISATNSGFIAMMALIGMMVVLTWFAHRSNIIKLIAGTEHKTKLRHIIKKVFTKKNKNQSA